MRCTTHDVPNCPACLLPRPVGGEGAPSPSLESNSAGARAEAEQPRFVVIATDGGRVVVAERLSALGVRYLVEVCAGQTEAMMRDAQEVADALNMLHHVRAGTAGIGASLEDEISKLTEELGQVRALSDLRSEALERAAAERDLAQAQVDELHAEVNRLCGQLAGKNFAAIKACINTIDLIEGEGSPGERTKVRIMEALAPLRDMYESNGPVPLDPATLKACIDLVKNIRGRGHGAIGRRDVIDELERYLSEAPAPSGADLAATGLPGSDGEQITVQLAEPTPPYRPYQRHRVAAEDCFAFEAVGFVPLVPIRDHCAASDEFPYAALEGTAALRALCDEIAADVAEEPAETAIDALAEHMGAHRDQDGVILPVYSLGGQEIGTVLLPRSIIVEMTGAARTAREIR